jgi:hypothetical protein
MVTINVKARGKPEIKLDFTQKHPNQVTIADVKSGVHTKFKKVTDPCCPPALDRADTTRSWSPIDSDSPSQTRRMREESPWPWWTSERP